MKKTTQTIISFLLVFVILVLLLSKVNIYQIIEHLNKINIVYYILGLIVFYLSFFPRGLRWNLLLRNIKIYKKTKDISEIYFLSWFANLILPAKLGDLYRGYLFKKNYNRSKSEIMGTVFMERFIDIIFLILFLTLSGFIIFKDKFSKTIQEYLILAYILLIIIIISFILIKKFRIKLSKLLPKKFQHIIPEFEKSASSCVKKDNILSLIFVTLVYWALEAGTLYFSAKALNIDLPFTIIIFVTLIAALISTIPITPSGAGFAEAGVTGILVAIGLNYDIALTLALVHRSIDYWSGLIIGTTVYTKSKLK